MALLQLSSSPWPGNGTALPHFLPPVFCYMEMWVLDKWLLGQRARCSTAVKREFLPLPWGFSLLNCSCCRLRFLEVHEKKKKIPIAWLVLMPAIFHFLWELCRSSFVLLVLEWTAMFMFLDLQGKSVLKVSAQSAGGKLFLHAICASRVSQAVPNLKCYVENCTGLDNFEAA